MYRPRSSSQTPPAKAGAPPQGHRPLPRVRKTPPVPPVGQRLPKEYRPESGLSHTVLSQCARAACALACPRGACKEPSPTPRGAPSSGPVGFHPNPSGPRGKRGHHDHPPLGKPHPRRETPPAHPTWATCCPSAPCHPASNGRTGASHGSTVAVELLHAVVVLMTALQPLADLLGTNRDVAAVGAPHTNHNEGWPLVGLLGTTVDVADAGMPHIPFTFISQKGADNR